MKYLSFILIPALCSCHSSKSLAVDEQHISELSTSVDNRDFRHIGLDSLYVTIDDPLIEIQETDDTAAVVRRTVIIGSKLEVSRHRAAMTAASSQSMATDNVASSSEHSQTVERKSDTHRGVARLAVIVTALGAIVLVLRRSWRGTDSRQ